MLKIIQISDECFWGYNDVIDITLYNSFEELGKYIKSKLILFLREYNLLILAEKAEKLKLHNHNYKSYDEIYHAKEDIIYLCCGVNCI
jgi:hypothetical protein